MGSLLIRGGRVIDPASGLDGEMDVLIEGDRIERIAPKLEVGEGVEVLDASGKWVLPGLVDVHVHLREPGYEYKEDIASGCAAAVAGGFTTICCKANTNPVNDTGAITRYIVDRAKEVGLCRVYPVGAVSKGLKGQELAEIGDMVENGAVAVSDDGEPVWNSELMRRALEYTRFFGIPVVDHCQDKALSADGVVHEGRFSAITGLKGMPASAEEVMVARDVILARETGGMLHIDHVSTAGSIKIIEWAKGEGVKVTCEVTPHHLSLTDEAILSFDTDTKVNPPLRGEEHVEALREALAKGLIDIIATDHAPHARVDKDVEYTAASFGISGLETALSLILKLVFDGVLPLKRAVEAMTIRPARVFGLDAGYLAEGGPADVTVVDPQMEWTVEPSEFFSKGKNTPFKGWRLKGKVFATIVGGRVVYFNGEIRG